MESEISCVLKSNNVVKPSTSIVEMLNGLNQMYEISNYDAT